MVHDETLFKIAEKVKNMAVICAPYFLSLRRGQRTCADRVASQTPSTSPKFPISTRWVPCCHFMSLADSD